MGLIELVPNVSEGRSVERVSELSRAFSSPPDIWLLDVHSDPAHHRSVLTAVARPSAIVEAALRLTESAVERIDLTRHRGEHPRMGAVDVLPLIPLEGVAREEAVRLARSTAETLAATFEVPVFLYGEAALRPEHRELRKLRRGGFEGLSARMASSELVPDFGPRRPHPTAGATAVGVRDFLVAFNVELQTTDRGLARSIARHVRFSSGGLPEVQALGFELHDRGRVQVSMNLTDFRITAIDDAFGLVCREARRLGVEIVRSEIVGLLPRAAALAGMTERLKLDRPPGIVEERILEAGIPP